MIVRLDWFHLFIYDFVKSSGSYLVIIAELIKYIYLEFDGLLQVYHLLQVTFLDHTRKDDNNGQLVIFQQLGNSIGEIG